MYPRSVLAILDKVIIMCHTFNIILLYSITLFTDHKTLWKWLKYAKSTSLIVFINHKINLNFPLHNKCHMTQRVENYLYCGKLGIQSCLQHDTMP